MHSKRGLLLLVILIGTIISILISFQEAAGRSIEAQIQSLLIESLKVTNRAIDKIESGSSPEEEIKRLSKLAEEVKVLNLLMKERFKQRGKAVVGRASERHERLRQRYTEVIREYLDTVDSIRHTVGSRQGDTPSAIRHRIGAINQHLHRLKGLLQGILYKKKRSILGSLPYRHLGYPSKEPAEGDGIKPAYLGGDKEVRSEDLKGSALAPITEEIASLAQKLNWSPVSIYEWVKNNIKTEWYWGCMKGALETLRQGAGNDCDQATLLVALLRASGYPARYVRGVVEFFVGRGEPIDRIKNLLGVEGPEAIVEYFQKAGIPYKPIIQGGRITNFQIEHIWVETQVPYANYRGAIIDEHGKTWLGLDTSIKVKGYEYQQGAEGAWQVAEELRGEYLRVVQTLTPLEYLKERLYTETGQPAEHYKRRRTLIPEEMKILPASLQFRQILITHEYTEIPEELIHKVRFRAGSMQGEDLFDVTLPAYKLSNQKITITYEPETVEDQQVINSYGGIANTPGYLVRLRPVLQVAGERVAVGRDGLAIGEEYTLEVELLSPNGPEAIENVHTVGNLVVMGIVSQKATGYKPSAIGHEPEEGADDLLFQQVMDYIKRWDEAEEELASLLHLSLIRPVPTVVTVGGVVEVTYLLDTPYDMQLKGIYIDADLRAVEVVESTHNTGDRPGATSHKLFMELSALQGSVLEHKVFEDNWQVEGISTAKLIQKAYSSQQTGLEIVTIDRTNVDNILSSLELDENIIEDIRDAVNQGLIVQLPYAINQEPNTITHEDWEGIGYIKEDPETGEAGYMLSGMVAGGMTAWSMERWEEYYRERLINPYSEPPEYDSSRARYIHKITATDMQEGTVGKELPIPLQVLVHTAEMRPVKGAEVTFTVRAGGGVFTNGQQSITVKTDFSGIASVKFIPGRYTRDNPTYLWYEDRDRAKYPYPEQVGENIVDASLSTGVSLTVPFTVYGFPDKPHHIRKLSGDGQRGMILSFAGFVSVAVEDQYGNPISNIPVDFTVLQPIEQTTCPNPNQDTRAAYLVRTEEACIDNIPLWRDCEKAAAQSLQVLTSPDGAAVQVVLGGMPGAEYPIEAVAGQLREVFHLYTYAFGNCDGDTEPDAQLIVQYTYPSDPYGNNIDAGSPGEEILLKARMYYLVEKGMNVDVTLNCDGNTKTCPKTVGSRQYEVVTDFTEAALRFSGIEGTAEGKGIYTAMYTLQPGLNIIEIQSSASIEQERAIANCSKCSRKTETITQTATATMEVYGVEVDIQPLPVVLLNQLGFVKEDYRINYRITPPQYRAYSGYLVLYKNGTPVEYIPIEPEPEGTITLTRGFWFDEEGRYEIEIILNYGTGVEIRSQRAALPVARIKVVNEEGEVKEIKYSDGGRAEKLYRVELISKALTEDCGNLTGKIKTVDKQWADTAPPDVNNYYPTEYPLEFKLSEGRCLVKIKDTTADGQTKDRFIVSNLPKAALTARKTDLSNTAVLYGGIGNKIEVEINGAKEHVGIEPVGVFLIAIDGLRQDVLYNPDEVSYSDPGGCGGKSCYIEPNLLKGLCEVLGGRYDGTTCDPTGWENRHIKLRDVTAIFPSITLASWASIFTGKMPKETGIVGNEFFGRDIYNCTSGPQCRKVPPYFDPPLGLITFGSGAFKGYDLYSKNQKAQWDFVPVLPGAEAKETSQNSILNSSTMTIFEWIGKQYNVSKYFGSYDRDVLVSGHYARGVDFWATADVGDIIFLMPQVLDEAKALDNIASYYSLRYLNAKLRDLLLQRNVVPFPALFVVYFGGLDHAAHFEGMNIYRQFLIEITDVKIGQIISWLKKYGEFDNKIFIITADHGHTAMPTSEQMVLSVPIKDESGNITDWQIWHGDDSCKLKLKKFNVDKVKYPELANNNLHIWELAEVMKAVGSIQNTVVRNKYRLLVPEKIEEVFKIKGTPIEYRATSKTEDADLVIAFNGPMAHIYSMIGTDNKTLGEIAEIFRVMLGGFYPDEAIKWFGFRDKYKYLKFQATKIRRLWNSIDKILIRMEDGKYYIFNGLDNNGNPITESLTSLTGGEYIEAELRIKGMNNEKRSGDIVLIMKDKTTGDAIDRYTTGSACKSWHGSLNPSDSYVPLIVSYPGGNKKEIEEILQRDTLCKQDYSGCRGNWRVTDIIKEIITEQYE